MTAIEWTDATWNPVRGCTKVSPGCANCYAETFAERFRGVKGHPYEQGFDLRLVPEKLEDPLHWKKPRRVFVNSMSDLFHEAVPDAYIDRVFAVMAMAPQHTFQVLTKRAERMARYLTDPETPLRVYREFALLPGFDRIVWPCMPLPNVWLGVSVENQHFADVRIPLLLQTPAAVRFLSCEPLLAPVDLERALLIHRHWKNADSLPRAPWCPEDPAKFWYEPQALRGINQRTPDWVIVGGESGAGARPFDIAWARTIVRQCKAAGVACFVKQLGANIRSGDRQFTFPPPARYQHTEDPVYGVKLHSRKGGDPAEWPADLRVREFPR